TGAEREPRLVEPAALHAFHRERNRPAGADRVDAKIVAEPRGAQHRAGVARAAQRTQREQAFVLEANTGAVVVVVLVGDGIQRVDVLAADSARYATRPRSAVRLTEFLG